MAGNSRLILHCLCTVAAAAALAAAGCGGSSACEDGIDNDADGLVDTLDPGCAVNGDAEFPEPPQCADGVDNDSDGIIDGADPGCAGADDDNEFNEPIAGCRDGIDNDSDGLIDFPNDPGCALSVDDEEMDECPDGETCPACGNGVDDDADGITDYPEDAGCQSAGDNDEFNADPTICGASVPVFQLPADGVAMGTFNAQGSNDLISGECGGTGTEVAYEFTINAPTALTITTDFPETTTDTVMYLREMCRLPNTEVDCNDDSGDTTAASMQIDSLPAGTYYLIIDSVGSDGAYRVQVDGFSPEGEECDPNDLTPCPPGLDCRIQTGDSTETCVPPQCKDGIDNDGDTLADWPEEPGCTSPEDSDETDPGTAPQCFNESDDDGDGLIDYAEDPGCDSAGDDLELECEAETDDVEPVVQRSYAGTTTTATHDLTGQSCASFGSAPDLVYSLNSPGALASLTVDTIGSDFDTVLYLRQDDCSSADLACNDQGGGNSTSKVDLSDLDAGIYLIVVDGYSSNSGNYVLNVHGELKAGESCPASAEDLDGPDDIFGNDDDPALVCVDGYTCSGGVCVEAACSDGNDNDSDGLFDYPDDPGCLSPSDGDETDPATDPICSNGSDDDGDGFTDYGDDPGCTSAGDDSEIDECIAGVPLTTLPQGGTSGTTPPLSAGSNFQGSCSSANSPEDVYLYYLDPAIYPDGLAQLSFTSTPSGFGNTVLHIRKGDCADSAAEIACEDTGSDGETAIIAPATPGFYYIFVDGDYSSAIDYDLSYQGVLPVNHDDCKADTAFSCPFPQTCQPNGNCQ